MAGKLALLPIKCRYATWGEDEWREKQEGNGFIIDRSIRLR